MTTRRHPIKDPQMRPAMFAPTPDASGPNTLVACPICDKWVQRCDGGVRSHLRVHRLPDDERTLTRQRMLSSLPAGRAKQKAEDATE